MIASAKNKEKMIRKSKTQQPKIANKQQKKEMFLLDRIDLQASAELHNKLKNSRRETVADIDFRTNGQKHESQVIN